MRFSLAYAGLLAALFVSSEAFSTIGTGASFTLLRPSTRSWHRATASSARPAAASAVMELADGKHADAFGRRGALAALAGVILSPALQPAFADDAGDEVVVQGEMRFEEGTDKKLARVGGKGTCVVTLRCVGKGIISETKFDVEASQFPPPGKPPKGKEVGGGVPFVVKVKDLKAKTEKGRTVDRDLWGDDDIFVRVDIRDGASDKKIASGLGKAKYLFDTKTHATSFVLLE